MKSIEKAILLLLFLFAFLTPSCADEIHDATRKGDLEKVKMLLEKDSKLVNATDDNERTPLHWAVLEQHIEIVKLLIEKGAKINSKDNGNFIPLHFSTWPNGCVEIAELLISKSADIKAKDVLGYTPLHYASRNGQIEIAKLLIVKGAEINLKNKDGLTPLHRAIDYNQKDMAEMLIDKGAEINAKDNIGNAPLYRAALLNHKEIAELLIAKGAELDLNNNYDRTPLHQAAISGYAEIVDLLISNGSKVNPEDKEGKTPLYFAAKYGNKKIAELLIAKGGIADDTVENYGYSPLLRKKLKENEAIIWYLFSCGWAIKTKSKLLIFDYWEPSKRPTEPLLANGHVNANEIKDLDVFVFVTHEHTDHYDKVIFEWEKSIKNITYIFGWQAQTNPKYVCMEGRKKKKIENMEILTLKANHGERGGVGFLIKADGLTIYHSGDHQNYRDELVSPFTNEIDYFAKNMNEIDIAFICYTGDWHIAGTFYTIEKLQPKVMFPMHAAGREYIHKQFAQKASKKNIRTKIHCAENRGDQFFYKNGKLVEEIK